MQGQGGGGGGRGEKSSKRTIGYKDDGLGLGPIVWLRDVGI